MRHRRIRGVKPLDVKGQVKTQAWRALGISLPVAQKMARQDFNPLDWWGWSEVQRAQAICCRAR